MIVVEQDIAKKILDSNKKYKPVFSKQSYKSIGQVF